MIIIAENKTNHYLMKKFLTAIENAKNSHLIENNNNSTKHVGLHQAFDPSKVDIHNEDDTVEIEDLELLSRSLNNEPAKQNKVLKLLNIATKGLIIPVIVAAAWFGSSTSETSTYEQIADTNNTTIDSVVVAAEPEEQAAPELVQLTQDQVELNSQDNQYKIPLDTLNKSTSFKTPKSLKDEIKDVEKFTPYPYKDESGISIGYGTLFLNNTAPENIPVDWRNVLYKRCNLSNAQIEKFENQNHEQELNEYTKEIQSQIDKIEARIENKRKELKKWNKIKNRAKRKRYTNNVKKAINRLENKSTNLENKSIIAKKRGVITKELAEVCFDIEIELIENNAIPKYFGKDFSLLDKELQEVIVDMMYNIGKDFLKATYKDFRKHINNYIKEIKKPNKDQQKIINLASLILTEISERSPAYLLQQKGSGRAKNNIKKLEKFLENIRNSTKTNESYSMKSVYKHLFV
jgi:hypothetical protein